MLPTWAQILDSLGPNTFAGLLTCDGILIEASRSALEAAGLSAEEVLGKPFAQTSWWAWSVPVQEQLRRAITRAAGGENVRYEVQVCVAPGTLAWVDFSLIPVRDASGAVTHLVPSASVIEAGKQAETALQESEGRYRTLVDWSPEALSVHRDGIIQFVNPAAIRLLGATTAQDLVGKRVLDLVHPRSLELVAERMRLASTRGADALPVEETLVALDGRIIDVEIQGRPISFDGAPALLSSMRDITERMRTDAALRQSHETFNQLADNISDAFWIRSPDMRVVHYVSPAFEQIWGRPVADLYGSPDRWVEFTVAEDRPRVTRAFASLMQDAPTIDIEYRIERPGGEIRWIRARGFQVRDRAGTLIRLTGIVTDITEKKQLESRVFRAQRMESIGTLAGGMAHDLNNVLAPILLSIELLQDALVNEDDRELLETLMSSAQRGAALVKQVLSFARGIEGQRLTVNPLHVMRELLKVMRDTFPKSMEVRFVPASGLWTVTGDPTQIHQVFLNLCVNARDAMPEGGELVISMQNVVIDETYASMNTDAHPGAYVMTEVKDCGTGIPVELRDRIFEPFFTTKKIGTGTGLGLSTSLAIVRSHGGFIHLYSESRGTQFKVYLPANTEMIAPDQAGAERPRLPRGHGELVLVVDDEQAIRTIAQRTLERFGYRVLLAGNGAEAVELYSAHASEVAAIITDMAMPVMDGPTAIIAFRSINASVRIIGSSGLTSKGGVAKAAGSGIKHFVPKPYTAEALLTTLQLALQEPSLP